MFKQESDENQKNQENRVVEIDPFDSSKNKEVELYDDVYIYPSILDKDIPYNSYEKFPYYLDILEVMGEAALRVCVANIDFKPDNNLILTKIGGKPYLNDNDEIPICPACGDKMLLVAQIELSKAPKRFKAEGLLQIFFCKRHYEFNFRTIDVPDTASLESFEGVDFTDSYRCEACNSKDLEVYEEFRLYPLSRRYRCNKCGNTNFLGALKSEFVLNWVEYEYEVPNERELRKWFDWVDIDVERFDRKTLTIRDLAKIFNNPETKFGGYPCYVNKLEVPNCPECGKEMELYLQVKDQPARPIPYVYMFRCSTHKTEYKIETMVNRFKIIVGESFRGNELEEIEKVRVRLKLPDTSVVKQAIKAYAELVLDDYDWETVSIDSILNWRSDVPIGGTDLIDIMTKIVGSYNNFDPTVHTKKLIEKFPDAEFYPARESSICIYIKPKSDKAFDHSYDTEEIRILVNADESDIHNGELRLWWD